MQNWISFEDESPQYNSVILCTDMSGNVLGELIVCYVDEFGDIRIPHSPVTHYLAHNRLLSEYICATYWSLIS